MTPSFGQAVVSLILVPSIALSAIVAPEHVHEADADHPRSAIHRHIQPHAVGSLDHDHARLADDDAHVVWLDCAGLLRPAYHCVPPAVAPSTPFELVRSVSEWVAAPDYDAAPPHGPPRASLSLRGPPCFSA